MLGQRIMPELHTAIPRLGGNALHPHNQPALYALVVLPGTTTSVNWTRYIVENFIIAGYCL
jgi:hypothetical protein